MKFCVRIRRSRRKVAIDLISAGMTALALIIQHWDLVSATISAVMLILSGDRAVRGRTSLIGGLSGIPWLMSLETWFPRHVRGDDVVQTLLSNRETRQQRGRKGTGGF